MKSRYTRIAEIGVSMGDNSRGMVNLLKGHQYKWHQLILVDLPDNEKTEDRYKFNPNRLHNCICMPIGSYKASLKFKDESLDIVFLDADTSCREALKKDIDLWLPKVRPGGTICGRYCVFVPGKPTSYIRHLIVDEFGEENISLFLLEEKCSGDRDYMWMYVKENNGENT